MVTVRAVDTSESMFQVTAFQVGSDYLGNDRPVKTIAADKPVIIYLLEMIKVIAGQSIQGGVGSETVNFFYYCGGLKYGPQKKKALA